jgi:hypothetical protein
MRVCVFLWQVQSCCICQQHTILLPYFTYLLLLVLDKCCSAGTSPAVQAVAAPSFLQPPCLPAILSFLHTSCCCLPLPAAPCCSPFLPEGSWPAVQALARRWRQRLAAGDMVYTAPPFWTTPGPTWWMQQVGSKRSSRGS